jgi:hypothetical protein
VILKFAELNWERKFLVLNLNIDFSVSSFKYLQITAFHLYSIMLATDDPTES